MRRLAVDGLVQEDADTALLLHMDSHAREWIPASVDDANLQIRFPQLVNTPVGLLTPRLAGPLDLVDDHLDSLDVVS